MSQKVLLFTVFIPFALALQRQNVNNLLQMLVLHTITYFLLPRVSIMFAHYPSGKLQYKPHGTVSRK